MDFKIDTTIYNTSPKTTFTFGRIYQLRFALWNLSLPLYLAVKRKHKNDRPKRLTTNSEGKVLLL